MQFKVINFEFCYITSTVFVAFLHTFVKKFSTVYICITDATPKHTTQ